MDTEKQSRVGKLHVEIGWKNLSNNKGQTFSTKRTTTLSIPVRYFCYRIYVAAELSSEGAAEKCRRDLVGRERNWKQHG